MNIGSRGVAMWIVLAAVPACGGGSDESTGSTGAGTVAETEDAPTTGSPTSPSTGSDLCGTPALAGSCMCSSADVFESACSGSGMACAEVSGEAIPFVQDAGSTDCGSNGTWTAGATCPTDGRLGGCKDTIGSTGGCPIERISWYYADPGANINTAADVMAVCSEYGGEFVAA